MTHPTDKSQVVAYPAPAGCELTSDFEVTVNGVPIAVYPARVSRIPINQVWPGYQRPLEQTELASFAAFDSGGPVRVQVTTHQDIKNVVIRPKSYGITPQVDGHTITFTLLHPGQIAVEVNGWHGALHLFADPLETDAPDPSDPRVRYFGPGVHHPGHIELTSGESVYLAGGSVVHGLISAENATGIKIHGRGILDASTFKREDRGNPIRLTRCTDVEISGIILRDPHVWTVVPVMCQRLTIRGIKLIGLWRYNSDGIDLVNCQDVLIEDCFVRAFDDNIVLKGFDTWGGGLPLEDITVRRCVVWNDWGRGLELGAETQAPAIRRVLFEDCDIIHYVHRALDIQNGDRAVISDVRFENIRIEEAIVEGAFREDYGQADTSVGLLVELTTRANPYSKNPERGVIRDIVLKDVKVDAEHVPPSVLVGHDDAHGVSAVTFDNVRVNGKLIANAEDGRIAIGEHVRDIRFR